MSSHKKKKILELLQLAVGFHQSGRLSEARKAYLSVLNKDPANADALNLLGMIADIQGNAADALVYFDRALATAPKLPAVHFNRANVLSALGRVAEADAGYRRAIELKTDYAEARLNQGALWHKNGDIEKATAIFRELAQSSPRDFRGYFNLGQCLFEGGQFTEAQSALSTCLNINPAHDDALAVMASIAAQFGRYKDAVSLLKSAIKIGPKIASRFSNLGNWLVQLRLHEEALVAHAIAHELDPDSFEVLFNFGTAFLASHDYSKAEKHLRTAIKRDPKNVMAFINLGETLKKLDQIEEALEVFEKGLAICSEEAGKIALSANKSSALSGLGDKKLKSDDLDGAVSLYEQAIAAAPSHPINDENTEIFRTNMAVSLLAAGRYAEAWPFFRSRYLKKPATPELPHSFAYPIHSGRTDKFNAIRRSLRRPFPYPEWAGDLSGTGRLLVWTDQGVGDEILFASMLPDLMQRYGAACMLECSERLVPVFQRSFPKITVVAQLTPPTAAIDDFVPTWQISLADLGNYFRPHIASFPVHSGYLIADTGRQDALRKRYQAIAAGRPIVGISWRSHNIRIGEAKSIELNQWEGLLGTPGILFVSLQYGDCRAEIEELRMRVGVELLQGLDVDPLKNLDDFSAHVACMDLVISSSNTTVHFAGALNVPTWTLVTKGGHVLWYFSRGVTTPWYPSMRLFRQENMGEWRGVFNRVGHELGQWRTAQATLATSGEGASEVNSVASSG